MESEATITSFCKQISNCDISEVMEYRGKLGIAINKEETFIKELKARRDKCDAGLIEKLDANGLVNTSTLAYQAIISTSILPKVEDWTEVYKYIVSSGNCNLLQKRISTNVYKELVSIGEPPPGVLTFEQRKINFRKK